MRTAIRCSAVTFGHRERFDTLRGMTSRHRLFTPKSPHLHELVLDLAGFLVPEVKLVAVQVLPLLAPQRSALELPLANQRGAFRTLLLLWLVFPRLSGDRPVSLESRVPGENMFISCHDYKILISCHVCKLP